MGYLKLEETVRVNHIRIGVFLTAVSAAAIGSAQAFTEGFEDINSLAAKGWLLQNRSTPVGENGWYQGDPAAPDSWSAQAGLANSFLQANFRNTSFPNPGAISNWLILPTVWLTNGDTLTFFTRTVSTPAFPDRLQVRMSTSGAATGFTLLPGAAGSAAELGNFTSLLLDINPSYTTSGYPSAWTQFTANVTGLAAPTSGRLAFRYFVDDTTSRGDLVGLDSVAYTPVPEPGTLVALGLGAAALLRRRRK